MGPFQLRGDTGPDVAGHRGGHPRGNSGTVQGSPWPGAGTKRLTASRHLPSLLALGLHKASGKHQRQDTPQSVTWSHTQHPRCYFQNPPRHEDFEPPAVQARGQAHTRGLRAQKARHPQARWPWVVWSNQEEPTRTETAGSRTRAGVLVTSAPRWHRGHSLPQHWGCQILKCQTVKEDAGIRVRRERRPAAHAGREQSEGTGNRGAAKRRAGVRAGANQSRDLSVSLRVPS